MDNTKERLLLIDGYNVMIAMNAVTHIVDHNTFPIGMYLGVLNQLRTFVDRFKPTKVVLAFDGPDAGERRRKVYPEYKGGRRVKARESKVQIMEGEDNIAYGVEGAFQNQFIKIFEFLKLLPVTTVMVPYSEADDVIAYLALKNKDERECIIISNDKDYLQLVQEGIMVYRWKVKKLYDVKAFAAEFKIPSANYIFKKIMLGDTGDKVPGVKGVGDKTFTKLEEPLSNNVLTNMSEFTTMLESMDYSELNTRETNAFKNCLEQKDKMDLAYSIMKLDENCMLEEQRDILKLQIDEQENKGFSRLSCKIKMQKNFFNKLYPGFNDDKWLQPFVFVKAGIKINC
jgi:5'-3' exonuclease